MNGGGIAWRALNKSVIPRADDRYEKLSQLETLGGPQATGRFQSLMGQVKNTRPSLRPDAPTPPAVATLAFFENFTDVIQESRRTSRKWYQLYGAVAAALVILFLGAGVLTVIAAAFWNADLGKLLAGSAITVGGGLTMWVWDPLAKMREALRADVRFQLVQSKYAAQIEACKANQNLTSPGGIAAAVECVAQVTDQILTELV
jgi:hypothetical protein